MRNCRPLLITKPLLGLAVNSQKQPHIRHHWIHCCGRHPCWVSKLQNSTRPKCFHIVYLRLIKKMWDITARLINLASILSGTIYLYQYCQIYCNNLARCHSTESKENIYATGSILSVCWLCFRMKLQHGSLLENRWISANNKNIMNFIANVIKAGITEDTSRAYLFT
jgi:hypothetical protein